MALVSTSSAFEIASGIMISGKTSTPSFATTTAASRMARTCIS